MRRGRGAGRAPQRRVRVGRSCVGSMLVIVTGLNTTVVTVTCQGILMVSWAQVGAPHHQRGTGSAPRRAGAREHARHRGGHGLDRLARPACEPGSWSGRWRRPTCARPMTTSPAWPSSARRCGRSSTPTTAEAVDPDDLRALNRAGRGGLRVRFGEDGGAALEPQAEEAIAAAIGRIVAVVFVAIADGTFIAAQGLPGPRLRLGVLRPVEEPVRPLVQHGDLRQPREGARTPRAAGHGVAHRAGRPAMPAGHSPCLVRRGGAGGGR